MKFIKKYSAVICIIASVIVLLVSFASYLFATLDERTLLAQTACVLALFAVIIGVLKFDDKD